MPTLTQAQRQFLRKQAHDLKPSVQVGKNGLSEQVISAVIQALEAHELIKVKLLDPGGAKEDVARALAEGSGGSLIALIGSMVILYREQPDPARRKVILPVL